VELALRHPSGTDNFEEAPRSLENLSIPEYDIKRDLEQVEDVEWIQLDQDRVQGWLLCT
jgi:hypothetical protein